MDPPRTYLMTPPPKNFVPPVRQVILLQVYGQASFSGPRKRGKRVWIHCLYNYLC